MEDANGNKVAALSTNASVGGRGLELTLADAPLIVALANSPAATAFAADAIMHRPRSPDAKRAIKARAQPRQLVDQATRRRQPLPRLISLNVRNLLRQLEREKIWGSNLWVVALIVECRNIDALSISRNTGSTGSPKPFASLGSSTELTSCGSSASRRLWPPATSSCSTEAVPGAMTYNASEKCHRVIGGSKVS